MIESDNADAAEIAHFNRISKLWWDPRGKMGQLHAINALRLGFITRQLAHSKAPRIVDVGCGGGILAEALAHTGAQVTGIDLSDLSLRVARDHARSENLVIDYRLLSAEDLAHGDAQGFDALTCMEMLEHVPRPEETIAACARLLRPGGYAFFSTINRNLKAFLFAIVAGEYILGLLPRGTHHYQKLIRPEEMYAWAASAGLEFQAVASLIYNPLRRTFRVAENREDVNYMACFRKPE